MAQLTWLQLKTARMQKETADKGVQFDGALDLFDCFNSVCNIVNCLYFKFNFSQNMVIIFENIKTFN